MDITELELTLARATLRQKGPCPLKLILPKTPELANHVLG